MSEACGSRSSAPAGWVRRWPGGSPRAGHRLDRLEPDPRHGRGGGHRSSRASAVAATAREAAAARRRGDRVARRRRGRAGGVPRRRRAGRRARPGHGGRRHQHRRAGDRSAAWRPTCARPARPWSTPRSRAASPASRAARILVMAGGDADAVERARPALESFAQRIILLGPLGSGRDDEARGQRDGLRAQPDPRRGAGARREGRRRARAGLRGDREQRGRRAVRAATSGRRTSIPSDAPVAFALDLVAKDLDLAAALAAEVGAAVPQLETNRRVVGEAIDAGLGQDDMSALAVHLRGSAGGVEG